MEPAGWDEFEKGLLRAGREAAPRATERAVLGALGLEGPFGGPGGEGLRPAPAPPPSGPFAVPAAPIGNTFIVAKWLAVGVLAAAIPFWLLRPTTPAPIGSQKPTSPAAQGRPSTEPAAPPVAPPASRALTLDQLPSEAAPPQKGPSLLPASPAQAPVELSEDAGDANSLAAELAQIKKARATLSAGQAAAALEELNRYQAAFPRPRLGSEATVLRIEALVKLGRSTEARTLAEPLLAPGSLYAERVRALLR